MMEKTVKASLITNKYCDIDYVMNRPCFMMGCKKEGKYAKKIYEGYWVFHCKRHATKEHMRIVWS